MLTLYTGTHCPDPSFVHTPLIEIRPAKDPAALRDALSRAGSFDYLLFTSRYAVAAVVGAGLSPVGPSAAAPSVGLSAVGPSPRVGYAAAVPQPPRVVAIGATTAAALRSSGFPLVEQPEEDNSPGIVAWFARQPRGRVLIPRSSLALALIPDGLRSRGFEVETVVAYQTVMPDHPRRVDLTAIGRIIFTSPSTIDHFIRLYGSLPTDKELVTRGPVTARHLRSRQSGSAPHKK